MSGEVAIQGRIAGALRNMSPSELFLWFLKNRDRHGLSEDYGWYASYAQDPDRLSYVWRHYDRRLDTVATLLTPETSLLEVGCGHGMELLWMALKGGPSVGIEPIKPLARLASRRKELLEEELGQTLDCEIRRENLFDMGGDETFDLVYLREAFHHIEPREKAVERLVRLLNPGGTLVISEANAWNPMIQLIQIRARGFQTVTEFEDEDGNVFPFGAERILTSARLTRLFRRHGLSSSRTLYFRLLPTAFARNRALTCAINTLERVWDNSPVLRPFYIHYEWVGRRTN